ncbi:MAG: DNA polymerase I [Firmicutes bacterium]|nr:DNA polymerase I [candidate division NPL-UPA2 bacterium]MBT9154287.1 DNA polymerase I [candidate division NPL-UPA2 bacterium]
MLVPRLFLIDGHALAFRAFYALEAALATKDGRPTNAVYGCALMLNKLIEKHKPDYILASFDRGSPTIRLERYPEYKAQRERMPDELRLQIDYIKELLQASGISIFEVDGHEADDVIGTLTRHAEEAGIDTVIVTSDRDSLQLVSPQTKVMLTRKGVTETELVGEVEVFAKYGLRPKQLVDLKAFMGDASDNIKGVKGVGEKTALALVGEFGSVEGVYARLDAITRPKLKEMLIAGREDAFLSKFLATIVRDVELGFDLSQFRLRVEDKPRLARLYRDLELHSLLRKLEGEASSIETQAQATTVKSQTYVSAPREQGNRAGLRLSEGEGMLLADAHGVRRIVASEPEQLGELRAILQDDAVIKVVCEYKAAERALEALGLSLGANVFDIELAAYLLDPSQATYTCSELAQQYLGQSVSSGEGEALVLPELSQRLTHELEKKNLSSLYYDVELPLARVLLAMERTGVAVDLSVLQDMEKHTSSRIHGLIEQIYSLAGQEFNISSPKQLGLILFEKLGLPTGKKTKTGYSTDAEVLEGLADQHEIVQKILEYRTLSKLKSTYLEGLQNAVDTKGLVHTTYNQTVAATGRLSSTEPNLQNIPIRLAEGRMIRRAFCPAFGFTHILAADYSQIELRILAHLSSDPILTAAFRGGEDIHTRTAAEVFEVSVESVTREMRDRAKAVNFGIVYGISDYGLARDIKVPRGVARDYIDNYFRRYAGVKAFIDSTIAQAKRDGFVLTLLHRRRYLPEINSSNATRRAFAERTAMNTPIQGTAADLIKLAMVRIHAELERANFKSRMILQVHDELIFETTTEELRPLALMVQDIMENALHLTVPLVVDIKVGSNWYNVGLPHA